MIFGITDEGVPTSKKEEYLIAIVALNNARTFFFFNHTAPPEIYTLSVPDALPL